MAAKAIVISFAGLVFSGGADASEQNLLKNPGFEEAASGIENPPNWTTRIDSTGKATITAAEVHGGHNAIAIPAHAAVEQKLDSVAAGAYLARCWVKSESEQSVTFLLQNSQQPWVAYSCTEIRVPRGEWTRIETFCAVDRDGSLTLTLGGMAKEFHLYHGTGEDMGSPIVADDFELVRYEPKLPANVSTLAVWDAPDKPGANFDWPPGDKWLAVDNPAHTFTGTPVLEGRHLAGAVRKSDGGLMVYAIREGATRRRCVIVPSPALPGARYTMVREKDRAGVRVSSATGDSSYTAWFATNGLIHVESSHVPQIQVQDCQLRYGLLPSIAGPDLCYAPAQLAGVKDFNTPSTQWFVGLVDGNDSMLVAAWETNAQAVSLRVAGSGENQLIDSVSIATDKQGFSLSFVEHTGLWHRELLKEDWLGDYTPIQWDRPFPARWLSHMFVTSGGKPSFRDPGLGYSFPIASAKTRMWGVWFEDWNHYPFFFDGPRTVFHFEKTFIPQGVALIYFLEPAAADLFSPSEIVEQALGHEKAVSLFDYDANRVRKLKYSTPDLFMFDRPVCATTTRLSKIRQDEKPTVGVNLATHLYEFIREIRGRVDQYRDYFSELKSYLAGQRKEHPEVRDYTVELEGLVAQAQAQSEEIYATSLSSVQAKIENMKALLREGKGDGFDCGKLDVRDTAGSQDDLCRRYNRFVIKLTQTAALKCGDSPAKALIATYIWEQSRGVLRQPTRWEPRRTLYFFEP